MCDGVRYKLCRLLLVADTHRRARRLVARLCCNIELGTKKMAVYVRYNMIGWRVLCLGLVVMYGSTAVQLQYSSRGPDISVHSAKRFWSRSSGLPHCFTMFYKALRSTGGIRHPLRSLEKETWNKHIMSSGQSVHGRSCVQTGDLQISRVPPPCPHSPQFGGHRQQFVGPSRTTLSSSLGKCTYAKRK